MSETMGLHTEEQLRVKRDAIRTATDDFAYKCFCGGFEDNELLYHRIENLHSLVVELKSG